MSIVEADWRDRLVPVLTALGGLAGAAVALVAARRPGAAADAGAVLAGVLIGGATTAALHGTRWGWGGLYADSSFRTQIATRLRRDPGLFDYNHRGGRPDYPTARPGSRDGSRR